LAQGRTLHPDVALITGYYSYVGPEGQQGMVDALRATADGVKHNAKRIVIIGDPPTRDKNPVDCLLAPNATLAGCTRPLNQDETAIAERVSEMAAADGDGFIDTTGWFCAQGECPLVIGNIIAYRDEDHITPTYSAALRGAFRGAFNAIVRPGKPA
jgi:hypothetical protein